MTKEVISVTPEKAEELLGTMVERHHPHHEDEREDSPWMRRKREEEAVIEEMVSDIESGNFDKDEANVVLDVDGNLFYGDNVLKAVYRYGKDVELNVYTLEAGDPSLHDYLNRRSKYRHHPHPMDRPMRRVRDSGGEPMER